MKYTPFLLIAMLSPTLFAGGFQEGSDGTSSVRARAQLFQRKIEEETHRVARDHTIQDTTKRQPGESQKVYKAKLTGMGFHPTIQTDGQRWTQENKAQLGLSTDVINPKAMREDPLQVQLEREYAAKKAYSPGTRDAEETIGYVHARKIAEQERAGEAAGGHSNGVAQAQPEALLLQLLQDGVLTPEEFDRQLEALQSSV